MRGRRQGALAVGWLALLGMLGMVQAAIGGDGGAAEAQEVERQGVRQEEESQRDEERRQEGEAPVAAFGETVEVALATFVVRVLDEDGDPVRGLGPENFLVTTGDERVEVVAVDWIGPEDGEAAEGAPGSGEVETGSGEETRAAGAADAEEEPLRAPEAGGETDRAATAAADASGGDAAPPAAHGGEPVTAPPGELIVLFVQADFHALRIHGHLKMLPFVRELLESLAPGDRVALVSFDSHLKLWRDFTLDREAVADAVYQAVRFGNQPEPGGAEESPSPPSLAAHWDDAAAADAPYPERGLELVARALEPLPGDKSIVFLGWGLGRYGFGGVRERHGYHRPAMEALEEAGASVFVLDVTDADRHTLEVGLRRIAAETGGTYQKTHVFPVQATRRLARILSGHYRLTVDADAMAVGQLDVQLVGLEKGVRLLLRPLRAERLRSPG